MTAETTPLVWVSRDLERTLALGAGVARLAEPGDAVALVGELGAGKTQFVRGMALGMGLAPEAVSSPTYVIMHEYGKPDSEMLLVHIDAYRLNGPEEMDDLALDDVRAESVLAVEWADRVMSALGEQVLTVSISHDADGRRLTLVPRGRWVAKIDRLSEALPD